MAFAIPFPDLYPRLPAAPAGFHWRELGRDDRPLMAAHWKAFDDDDRRLRFWDVCPDGMLDFRAQLFDGRSVRIVALFAESGEMAACAEEAQCLDDEEASEVAFSVSRAFRGQGLGKLALRGGLVLARERGSLTARVECLPEHLACLAICRAVGGRPVLVADDEPGFMRTEFSLSLSLSRSLDRLPLVGAIARSPLAVRAIDWIQQHRR